MRDRSASTVHLLTSRNALAAPDQPPHAAKVENADPQAIPKAVVRCAVPARPIDDIDVADIETLAPDQSRQKAVQRVEIGQRQEKIFVECFESTSSVARAVLEHGPAHPIGDLRLQLLKAACLAPHALTGDKAELGRA